MTILECRELDRQINEWTAKTDACFFPVLRAENNQVYLYLEPEINTERGSKKIAEYTEQASALTNELHIGNAEFLWRDNYRDRQEYVIRYWLAKTGGVKMDSTYDDFLYYADGEGFTITDRDIFVNGADNLLRQFKLFLENNPKYTLKSEDGNLVLRRAS